MSPTSYQTAPPRVAPYVLAKNRTSGRRRTAPHPRAHPHSILPVRVAVVDIGTNSTRLLVADVDPHADSVEELERRSTVTRLGHGVDASGSLAEDAMQRVFDTLADYRAAIDRLGATANLAVLTSAVRDAANGARFAQRVRDDFGLDAKVLSGDEEAQLTFLGAMSGRPELGQDGGEDDGEDNDAPRTVVIDIGGGSTEFVVGVGRTARFHTSLRAGVVRMSERHIHSDPPDPDELQALAQDVHRTLLDGLPAEECDAVQRGIAVAGTATSAAAIDQELDPYDPARAHGYRLQLATVEMLLARLADMDEQQRRNVVGLHPDRAPTIVAGMILLQEAMLAFELESVEVSEHDILYGGALQLAGSS
jgi:exopolyphosphatase/guanosine-5'-triphosphate,3'-diphosphate pyrophosphatase